VKTYESLNRMGGTNFIHLVLYFKIQSNLRFILGYTLVDRHNV